MIIDLQTLFFSSQVIDFRRALGLIPQPPDSLFCKLQKSLSARLKTARIGRKNAELSAECLTCRKIAGFDFSQILKPLIFTPPSRLARLMTSRRGYLFALARGRCASEFVASFGVFYPVARMSPGEQNTGKLGKTCRFRPFGFCVV